MESNDQKCTRASIVTLRDLRAMVEKEAINLSPTRLGGIDPNYVLELTKCIHRTTEKSISDYLARNKEILLNEHASQLRRDVICNMKLQMDALHDEVAHDALKLEHDVSNLLQLVGENNSATAASFRRMVEAAKSNYEKTELVKKTHHELFDLKSKVSQLEQDLLEYLMCTAFLDILAPPTNDDGTKCFVIPKTFLRDCFPSGRESTEISTSPKDVLENLLQSGESFEPIEVRLKSPDEVTKLVDKLKDGNQVLVHNTQLGRGDVKDEKDAFLQAKQKMEEELEEWDRNISTAEKEIESAKETWQKLNALVSNLKGEYMDDAERTRKEAEMRKIADIYRLCTDSEATHIDLTLMTATINIHLDDLLNELSKYPKKSIKQFMKKLEAEKKQSARKRERRK